MKDLFITLRARSVSSIVIGLTLIALCFSVGEGLRLTPFPVSAQLDPSSTLTTSGTTPLRVDQYGPLAVPTPLQKRDKRFAIDLVGPVSTYSYELFARSFPAPEHQPNTVVSVFPVAFPSDRAPPLTRLVSS
jgi:hypothetical protein